MALPRQLPWDQASNKWAAQIDPVLNKPILQDNILTDVKLIAGTNVINHLLQRTQQGWIITDIQGVATIYRSAPFNNLTLTLTSSAAVTVSLLVF